jgi:hypothetical protein
MALTLEQWDYQVGHHLKEIVSHVDSIASHAKALMALPTWETNAEDRLEQAEGLLTEALARVVAARVTMRSKARDN